MTACCIRFVGYEVVLRSIRGSALAIWESALANEEMTAS